MTKILIAEDDLIMVKLIEYNLKNFNAELIICRDGPAVEKTLEKTIPDIVLLDLMLPGKSGLELIADIRQKKLTKDLPVIFITGQGKMSTQEELFDAGANEVFTKPFSPRQLIDTIEKLLNSKATTPN